MTELYQTEEEQIEAIKGWWKENGKSIILGFVIGIAGIGGYRFWQSNQEEQAKQASMVFDEVVSLSKNDKKEFIAKVNDIELRHAGTSYADLSAFIAAKQLVEQKDYKGAKQQLEWVLNNSKQQGFVHIARIRLSKVLIQLGEYKSVLELIKDIKSDGFESTYSELRGDVYAALKDIEKAKSEYQSAANKLIQGDPRRNALQMKSNNLPASNIPLASAVKE